MGCRYPAEPAEFEGSAPSVMGADGGVVVAVESPDAPSDDEVEPESGVVVPDGVDEAGGPPVSEAVDEGSPVLPGGGGAEDVAPVAGALGVGLDHGVVPVPVPVPAPGLVAGHGRGAPGSPRTPAWGHRKRPRQRPAAARTPPAARRAARTRRRARTPARSRSRCRGSNAVGSRSPCINRVSCRSK